MSNAFDEVRAAVDMAKHQLAAADEVAGNMAYLLRKRLRHVHNEATLRELKRELQDFNMRTGKWKGLGHD